MKTLIWSLIAAAGVGAGIYAIANFSNPPQNQQSIATSTGQFVQSTSTISAVSSSQNQATTTTTASNTSAQIQSQAQAPSAGSNPSPLSSNLCDYLTPSLVSQYVSAPVQLDSSAAFMQASLCVYNTAGTKPGTNDILQLQLITKGQSPDVINLARKQQMSTGRFTDDSSIGFPAWYTPNNVNKNEVELYFGSVGTIMAVDVGQPNADFATNLQSAENLAKAIEPQLP